MASINHALLMNLRQTAGREAGPAASAIDGRSVTTTKAGSPYGSAAGKMIKGRKRRILIDTSSLPITMIADTANVQNRDGAPALPERVGGLVSWLRHVRRWRVRGTS